MMWRRQTDSGNSSCVMDKNMSEIFTSCISEHHPVLSNGKTTAQCSVMPGQCWHHTQSDVITRWHHLAPLSAESDASEVWCHVVFTGLLCLSGWHQRSFTSPKLSESAAAVCVEGRRVKMNSVSTETVSSQILWAFSKIVKKMIKTKKGTCSC